LKKIKKELNIFLKDEPRTFIDDLHVESGEKKDNNGGGNEKKNSPLRARDIG